MEVATLPVTLLSIIARCKLLNGHTYISHTAHLAACSISLLAVTMITYIVLTKCQGDARRISGRGLDSRQKRPRANILPVRSRASLTDKRFIIRVKMFTKNAAVTD